MNDKFNRRQFMKVIGLGGFSLYLASDFPFLSVPYKTPHLSSGDISPIQIIDGKAPNEFFGDFFMAAHKHIRDKKPGEIKITHRLKKNVVIIGGGLSGLFSAYFLKDHQPLLLEQGPHLGGNAKGQSWRGLVYPLGSAYAVKPPEGSDLDKVYKDLKLYKQGEPHNEEDPFIWDGKIVSEFWTSKEVDANPHQRKALVELFENMASSQNGLMYPNIPPQNKEEFDYVKSLDKMTFTQYLEKYLEEPLDEKIKVFLDFYCFGAFGGSCDEISAACALNFYSADQTELLVFPGGNGQIAQSLCENLKSNLPADHIRANELVISVRVENSKAYVLSLNTQNEEVTEIECEAAVMACPKFVVKRILQDIEPERLEAITQMRYRPYLTANICLDVPVEKFFYSLRVIDSSGFNGKSTDCAFGSFASDDSNKNTVLTLYRPMGHESDRIKLLQKGAFEKYKQDFENELIETIFPLLNISKESIVDMRIARFGHALPLAAQGLLAANVGPTVSAPFKERVFFVEQDNWALPCVETCFTEALTWKPKIEKAITQHAVNQVRQPAGVPSSN